MGALTVYLTSRDTLQAAGVLKPDYNVAERETYQYVAEEGSTFVVRSSGLFSRAKREFVAGPRKGQVEIISDEQVEEYRMQAEKEWGKYIPGTLSELLPAEAGRLEENVSYGLKSFAHDLVIRKLSPASSGSVPYFMSSRLCELVRYFSIPKF